MDIDCFTLNRAKSVLPTSKNRHWLSTLKITTCEHVPETYLLMMQSLPRSSTSFRCCDLRATVKSKCLLAYDLRSATYNIHEHSDMKDSHLTNDISTVKSETKYLASVCNVADSGYLSYFIILVKNCITLFHENCCSPSEEFFVKM